MKDMKINNPFRRSWSSNGRSFSVGLLKHHLDVTLLIVDGVAIRGDWRAIREPHWTLQRGRTTQHAFCLQRLRDKIWVQRNGCPVRAKMSNLATKLANCVLIDANSILLRFVGSSDLVMRFGWQFHLTLTNALLKTLWVSGIRWFKNSPTNVLRARRYRGFDLGFFRLSWKNFDNEA